jgi:hypothetical protein
MKEAIREQKKEKMIVAMNLKVETITKVEVEMKKIHLQVERMNRQEMKREAPLVRLLPFNPHNQNHYFLVYQIVLGLAKENSSFERSVGQIDIDSMSRERSSKRASMVS